jgi:hypothetical protein
MTKPCGLKFAVVFVGKFAGVSAGGSLISGEIAQFFNFGRTLPPPTALTREDSDLNLRQRSLKLVNERRMSEVAAVLRHIRTCLPDLRSTTLGPEYNYASLPLCVIDAVYSIGVLYRPTIPRTVQNWCLRQQPQWPMYRTAGGSEHSIENFVELLEGQDFEALATDAFRNRQRTSTSSGILKAEAVYRFAKVLRDFHINLFGDTEDLTINQSVGEAIRKIPGQKSGIFRFHIFSCSLDRMSSSKRIA